MFDVEIEDMAFLVDAEPRGGDASEHGAPGILGEVIVAPDGGILHSFASVIGIFDGEGGPIGEGETALDEALASIEEQLVVVEMDPAIGRGRIAAAAIVIIAELVVTGAEEADLRVLQVELKSVIVVIVDAVAVDGERALFADGILVMEFLEAAVGAGPELLEALELGLVAIGEHAADADGDGVAEFAWSGVERRGGLVGGRGGVGAEEWGSGGGQGREDQRTEGGVEVPGRNGIEGIHGVSFTLIGCGCARNGGTS